MTSNYLLFVLILNIIGWLCGFGTKFFNFFFFEYIIYTIIQNVYEIAPSFGLISKIIHKRMSINKVQWRRRSSPDSFCASSIPTLEFFFYLKSVCILIEYYSPLSCADLPAVVPWVSLLYIHVTYKQTTNYYILLLIYQVCMPKSKKEKEQFQCALYSYFVTHFKSDLSPPVVPNKQCRIRGRKGKCKCVWRRLYVIQKK